MMSTQRDNINRRLSRSSSERVVFRTNDAPIETSYNSSYNCDTLCPSENSYFYSSCQDTNRFQPNDRSALRLPILDDEQRYNVCTGSKPSGQKQDRNSLELDQRSSRRSSVQSNRSRINNCNRATPLGNGRRNSLSRTTRPRRASTSRRRDSVQPIKTEIKEVEKVAESVQDLEEARRHRRITVIILGTFLFLLVAAVLAVVVTLTHSTFSRSAVGSKEHRLSLRKENEELLNSLNRDFTVENTTMPP